MKTVKPLKQCGFSKASHNRCRSISSKKSLILNWDATKNKLKLPFLMLMEWWFCGLMSLSPNEEIHIVASSEMQTLASQPVNQWAPSKQFHDAVEAVCANKGRREAKDQKHKSRMDCYQRVTQRVNKNEADAHDLKRVSKLGNTKWLHLAIAATSNLTPAFTGRCSRWSWAWTDTTRKQSRNSVMNHCPYPPKKEDKKITDSEQRQQEKMLFATWLFSKTNCHYISFVLFLQAHIHR